MSHSLHVLKTGALTRWKSCLQLRVTSTLHLERATEHDSAKLKSGTLKAWRQVRGRGWIVCGCGLQGLTVWVWLDAV